VNDRDTAAPTFPAASIALTEMVWWPLGSPAFGLKGERHGAKALASNWHWKVDPGSFEVNLKVGLANVIVAPSAGPDVIAAVGGTLSAVNAL
jgi:hypothetical protein